MPSLLSLPNLSSFSLPKPDWVKGLKRVLVKPTVGLGFGEGSLHSRLLDSDSESDADSVLGTDVDVCEHEADGLLVEEGEVPSLVEICGRVVFDNDELRPVLQRRGTLSVRDVWAILKERRDKEAEIIRTKHTVSLRGNRDKAADLLLTLSKRINSCDSVKSLVLDDCVALNDSALLWLCIRGKQPAIPQLQHLSVASCRQVTDASLVQIIKTYNTRLRTVCFSQSGASQKTMKALIKYCPEIETVSFSHQLTIQDHHLVGLAQKCRKIRVIDASYCKLITDTGVSAIAANLWHLEALNLSYCEKVGKSIADLRACKFLQRLRLQDCPLVSDRALCPLFGGCTNLEVVCLRGCPLVRMESMQRVADCCTKLRNLDVAGIGVNGNKVMLTLAQSPFIRQTLKEFNSTQKVILRMSPHIWKLYGVEV
ncbi:hypothetical protein BSKO_06579 [Bryopsis sp. KO-2023]|nr:hypothetical protein BSKO_06579 [Bryopsis sp. KO-2023]